MSAQESFTGMAMIHIIEATGLKPVMVPGGKLLTVMDPYCVIDFDDIYFGRTNNKKATSSPVWGETLEESIEDAQRMQITLFHSSLIPPDNFIAHSQIYVSELLQLTQGGHEEHEVPNLARQTDSTDTHLLSTTRAFHMEFPPRHAWW